MLRVVAEQACASIVKHYSDPIYSVCPHSINCSGTDDPIDTDSITKSDLFKCMNVDPYFDIIFGKTSIPDLPPLSKVWLDRLLELIGTNYHYSFDDMNERKEISFFDLTRELLSCYESIIQPSFNNMENLQKDNLNESITRHQESTFAIMIQVIIQYELLVAHVIKGIKTQLEDYLAVACNNEYHTFTNSKTLRVINEDSSKITDQRKSVLIIGRVIYLVANDICHLTGMLPKDNQELMRKIQNILFPYLLRVVEHCVTLLAVLRFKGMSGSEEALASEALAIATVISVSFVATGALKEGKFSAGSILEWYYTAMNVEEFSRKINPLSLAHSAKHCLLPPSIDNYLTTNFMTRLVFDWSASKAHIKCHWTDGISGIGSRTALSLLHLIDQICTSSKSVETSRGKILPGSNQKQLRLFLSHISEYIGIDVLISTIRFFFYGRLVFPASDPEVELNVCHQRTGPFMPVIQRLNLSQKKMNDVSTLVNSEKVYVEHQIRLTATSIILCAVFPQSIDVDTYDKAFSVALPLVLSLLDDVQSLHQGIGAILFLAFIEASSSYEFASVPSFAENFYSVLNHTLASAIQTCDKEDPIVFTVLCLAQSKWLQFLQFIKKLTPESQRAMPLFSVYSWTQNAAAELLIAVRKLIHREGRDGTDVSIAGAFVAGINPLLAQLAEFTELGSIDIGRVGLSAILPLIGWRGMSLESRAIQVASLCGLISLMIGSYPIMNHHGAKIMVEVFLLLHRVDADAKFLAETNQTKYGTVECHEIEDATEITSQIVIHVAAVALAVCGGRAEEVLYHIESKEISTTHISKCLEIRSLSTKLRYR